MLDGYCFELEGADWFASVNDDWAIAVYRPTGAETLVGWRWIDGSRCNVFLCPDGIVRAQTRR